jgi:hypothetical protein
MAAEHIRALDGIGFDWGLSKTEVSSTWSQRFEQLREFKLQLGHCLVPQRYAANPILGNWVSYQRHTYKLHQGGKPSPMAEECIKALNGVGFDWSGTSWGLRFQELEDYKERFGICLVPRQYASNPKLGRWVSTRRYHYKLYQGGKSSQMTEERIRVLENPRIGFKWKLRK